MRPRTYAVGLPVWVTFNEDGTVTASVDLTELGQAIREDDNPLVDGDDKPIEISDADREADALVAEMWSDEHAGSQSVYGGWYDRSELPVGPPG